MEATKEGLEIGRLMVAAGRALDDPRKADAAKRVLFRFSRPRDIVLCRISRKENND